MCVCVLLGSSCCVTSSSSLLLKIVEYQRWEVGAAQAGQTLSRGYRRYHAGQLYAADNAGAAVVKQELLTVVRAYSSDILQLNGDG